MPLYTCFLDYRKGIYISQVRAKSYASVPNVWAKKLDLTNFKGCDENDRQELLYNLQYKEPVAITGIKNTWCFSTLIKDHLALIHFTQTSE